MRSLDPAVLVARIRSRCVECGGCLVWQSAPSESHPYLHVLGRNLSARRVMYEHVHGPIPHGHCIVPSCGHRWCMKHLAAVTRSELNRRIAQTGVWASVARRSKIAATQQAKRSPLTPEKVADIRNGPGSLREAALRNQCSKSCAAAIRRGERWRDLSNPYLQLESRA